MGQLSIGELRTKCAITYTVLYKTYFLLDLHFYFSQVNPVHYKPCKSKDKKGPGGIYCF